MVTRRRCDPGIDEGGWIGVDLFQIKDRGDTESRFSLSSRRMEMTTKRVFFGKLWKLRISGDQGLVSIIIKMKSRLFQGNISVSFTSWVSLQRMEIRLINLGYGENGFSG